ncbi:MAG: methyltransferase domain-containing protein [Leptospiraceae bacterium]|nr:methyltransferase domain-containing protein [Leptospiraceae bacterium]
MTESTLNQKEIGEFYESITAMFWEIIHKRHMHSGFRDETNMDDNPFEASLRFTKMMVNWTEITGEGRFYDAGCGFGLPAIRLVEAKRCDLIGVTASKYQANEANKLAEQEGFQNKAKFIVGDSNNLNFEDNYFDGAWFFESFIHMGISALKEAHRVLKPESLLLIADFIKLETFSNEDEKILKNHISLSSLYEIKDFPPILEENGFKLLEIRDITKESKAKVLEYYIDELERRKNLLINRFGEKEYLYLSDIAMKWAKMRNEKLGYCVIKARIKKGK